MNDPLEPLPITTIAIYLKDTEQPSAVMKSLRRLLSGKPADDIQYPVLMEGSRGDPIGYVHQSSVNSLVSLLGINNLYAIKPDGTKIIGNMLLSL